MSLPVMDLDNGNTVHKAAITALEAKDGGDRTDPRVIVYLRTGATMVSVHPSYEKALEERDRLKADWRA